MSTAKCSGKATFTSLLCCSVLQWNWNWTCSFKNYIRLASITEDAYVPTINKRSQPGVADIFPRGRDNVSEKPRNLFDYEHAEKHCFILRNITDLSRDIYYRDITLKWNYNLYDGCRSLAPHIVYDCPYDFKFQGGGRTWVFFCIRKWAQLVLTVEKHWFDICYY